MSVWYSGTMLRAEAHCPDSPLWSNSAQKKATCGGGMSNKTEIWLFEMVNMDEIDWNFHGWILHPRLTFSRGIHSPDPPVLCTSMQKKPCLGWEVARFSEATKRQQQGDTISYLRRNGRWWSMRTLQSFVGDLVEARPSNLKCRHLAWSTNQKQFLGSCKLAMAKEVLSESGFHFLTFWQLQLEL